MLQKVVTSLNSDASEFLIELHEQLNPYVAAALIDATVADSKVYADESGMLYLAVKLGGEGVAAKRADLEKDDTVDDKGQPKPVDPNVKPEDAPKTPQQKLDAAFAESKKKAADDKAKAKAALAPPPTPPAPTTVVSHSLSVAGASSTVTEVPPKEEDKSAAAKSAATPAAAPASTSTKPGDEEEAVTTGAGKPQPGKPLRPGK